MTHRARMQLVVNHQKPDRTPATIGARPEINRALMEHFGVDSMGEVNRILGADGWAGVGVGIEFPGFKQKVNGRLTGDCPYAGGEYIFHEEDVFEDQWGVIRRKGADGKYVQWLSGPISDTDNLEGWDFPTPERVIDDPSLPDRVRKLKAEGLWVSGGVTQPYKTAWEQRGMENLLADYLLNPGLVEAIYDRIYALYGEMARRMVAAGIDQIGVGGDIAMQDRLIMGPESWRRIDKPRLAALIASCKQINPRVHVFIHSDGKLDTIMPDLVEIGFDIIDPIQPECMDPFEIKRLYGDRIVLHGCGSLQQILPFGSARDVRRHVEELIEGCGYNGGLVLRVSNAIGWDVPLGNVLAFYETARDYDMSRL